MKSRKPRVDILTPEERKIYIEKIIDHFATERDEQIGLIAAEELLDMFLKITAKSLFNQGVKDTQELIQNRFQELDFEIELLLKDK